MFGPKFAFFCAACLLRSDPGSCPKDTQEVTAKPGQDVPLQCRDPRGASITLIEWSRPDLKSDQYVFLFRDDHPNENYQLPSFRGRVELRDPEMKDGDASVVLKNVTTSDSGTYECRVSAGSSSEGHTPDPISSITLTVTDPGLTAGHKEGGHKEGGNKEGGNKEGGNKEGGNKEGGNKEGGNKDSVGVGAGVPVAVLLLVVGVVGVVGVVVGLVFRRRRGRTEKNSHQPAETESVFQLE